jgi:hypothetical protein
MKLHALLHGIAAPPVASGGGTFVPMRDQTMPSRDGALCAFAPAATVQPCGCSAGDGGCSEGCACEEPVPDTGTSSGTGGVQDAVLTARWAKTG